MQLLLFILLGCNVPTLLEGRIKKAVEFANATVNATQIDWFLSGGIKNPAEDTETEANDFMWALAPEELHDSRYWEQVHIKNVDADVSKARRKFL